MNFKYSFIEVLSTYNNSHILKVLNLMSFDMFIPRNHHHNQDNECIQHPHKLTGAPWYSLSPLLPPRASPFPRQPLICFLSLYISLHFLEVRINGIIKYKLFLVWFFSLSLILLIFMCVTAYFRTSFLFLVVQSYGYATVCLSIYLLLDIWLVSSLGLLQKKLYNICVQVWTYAFVFLW